VRCGNGKRQEVIVIGAGTIGCATTYYLAKNGINVKQTTVSTLLNYTTVKVSGRLPV